MEKKKPGMGIRDRLQGAVDSVKSTVSDVRLPDIKAPDVRELFRRRNDGQNEPSEPERNDEVQQLSGSVDMGKEESENATNPTSGEGNDQHCGKSHEKKISIPVRNALKIFFFLIAADGKILDDEMGCFDEIGAALDPEFDAHKEGIISECNAQLENTIDPEDYYDVLQDAVGDALSYSDDEKESLITPRMLLWNMLTIAYCDGEYALAERRLIKRVVRKLNIDKAVYLEMESSIQTISELENELEWIKTTNRPYLQIEEMVNRINHRKDTIFESVMSLVTM